MFNHFGDKCHLCGGEDFLQHVNDTRNEWFAHSPQWRERMGG